MLLAQALVVLVIAMSVNVFFLFASSFHTAPYDTTHLTYYCDEQSVRGCYRHMIDLLGRQRTKADALGVYSLSIHSLYWYS